MFHHPCQRQGNQNLESFVDVVKDLPDKTYVKLRVVSFDNIPMAISLKTDYHYFPTIDVRKEIDTNTWVEKNTMNSNIYIIYIYIFL